MHFTPRRLLSTGPWEAAKIRKLSPEMQVKTQFSSLSALQWPGHMWLTRDYRSGWGWEGEGWGRAKVANIRRRASRALVTCNMPTSPLSERRVLGGTTRIGQRYASYGLRYAAFAFWPKLRYRITIRYILSRYRNTGIVNKRT